ncbi:DUF805 domain-containing protein [Tenacibaculum crassostreae]|uniref:DUF805 domain-containing protein n=1 Tax=Tenacibaculum crassostreae TaxID=502683 RepID=UPI003892FE7A
MEENYYSNEGRINRKKFIIRTLIFILSTGVSIGFFKKICKLLNIGNLNSSPFRDPLNSPWTFLALIVVILSIIWIIQAMKRLQDLNISGWFSLIIIPLAFIPFIGQIGIIGLIIYLMVKEGSKEKNKYGLPDK